MVQSIDFDQSVSSRNAGYEHDSLSTNSEVFACHKFGTLYGSGPGLVDLPSAALQHQHQHQRQYQHQQPYHSAYLHNDWNQLAESTLPLRPSNLATAYTCNDVDVESINYSQLMGYRNSWTSYKDDSYAGDGGAHRDTDARRALLQPNIEQRARDISNKLILVNLVSLIINLSLAIVAFYFAFMNNSPSTSAFAADCVLDFISSAIVLWRYHGELSSVYMHAREQIACIYLGALFEISALAIIVKATSDMLTAPNTTAELDVAGYELVYMASVATIGCSVLAVFKCALYKATRDSSILLDVINTLISTVFALSIIMSQALINIDPSFWYLDPILSVVLALFMAAFGAKVIYQNFDILRPSFGPHQSQLNPVSKLFNTIKKSDTSNAYVSI